ncbi:hypothetical protein [Mesorhizobium amorphae]|uniref:hypothetical protein n=1 Tax=Mesorhizobium amorphae TaxID=71433 RepID=UPI0021B2E9B5|nr:hypothetical protein [Mesorhizobium amorphae]
MTAVTTGGYVGVFGRDEIFSPSVQNTRFYIDGNDGHDVIFGDKLEDHLVGGLGTDFLLGGGSDDYILGDEYWMMRHRTQTQQVPRPLMEFTGATAMTRFTQVEETITSAETRATIIL